MKKIFLVLFIMLFSMPIMAFDYNNYTDLKMGVFMPNDDEDGLKDFDNGLSIGASFGHRINQNFALEAGIEFNACKLSESEQGINIDIKTTTFSIPLTAKAIAPLSETANLYAGLGIGIYSTKIDLDVSSGGRSASDSAEGNCIGFHGVLGGEFKLQPTMALFGELKFTKVEQDMDEPIDDNVEVGGTTANFGLKFLF